MTWRIAWRNLWRHRGRTVIMASTVALIYGLMLVSMGINDDGHRRMLEEAISAAGGELLVHAEGYWDTRASDLVIREGEAVYERVRAAEGVRLTIPRVVIDGLASTAAGSQPVFLQGVLPELEAELADPAADLVRGDFLEGDRRAPIVLGARIADRLDAEVGDRIVLTASDPEGELTRALFHLVGVLETGTRDLDETIGYTTLQAAREAVAMEGMLTQVGVMAAGGQDADALADRLRAAVADTERLEVLTWREALPEMVGFIELDDAFGALFMAVLLVVVLFSITNTFLMAVMERVRELGLLNALGLRGSRIGRLLLAETTLLTALAMGAGLLLGLAGHLAISHWGIPMHAYGVDEMEVSGVDFADLVIYSTIQPARWAFASAIVAFFTVASALYPAWRASRLAPAEAMRFYE